MNGMNAALTAGCREDDILERCDRFDFEAVDGRFWLVIIGADMTHASELAAILKQVEPWTAEEKHWLAEKLSAQAALSREQPPLRIPLPPEKRRSFGELRGIANPSRIAFTDQEIDDLRFDALKEKYLK